MRSVYSANVRRVGAEICFHPYIQQLDRSTHVHPSSVPSHPPLGIRSDTICTQGPPFSRRDTVRRSCIASLRTRTRYPRCPLRGRQNEAIRQACQVDAYNPSSSWRGSNRNRLLNRNRRHNSHHDHHNQHHDSNSSFVETSSPTSDMDMTKSRIMTGDQISSPPLLL